MKILKFLISLLLLTFLISGVAYAWAGHGQTQLAWDANSESDLAGYIVHYGNSPGDYVYAYRVPLSTIEDPTNPTVTIRGLEPGTYYYVVSAYNTENGESDYSNMVEDSFTIPNAPQNLRKVTVTIQLE